MDRQLRSQVLLGTDWPMLRYARLVEELPLLELRPESYEAYVRGNAQRLIERVWG
jgi:predicted TIM-barrel fold metal-dependent hydrolase